MIIASEAALAKFPLNRTMDVDEAVRAAFERFLKFAPGLDVLVTTDIAKSADDYRLRRYPDVMMALPSKVKITSQKLNAFVAVVEAQCDAMRLADQRIVMDVYVASEQVIDDLVATALTRSAA